LKIPNQICTPGSFVHYKIGRNSLDFLLIFVCFN
jgi:hypothetical protein